MDGVGQRLKERARALDLSDAEVARRLEMNQNRYAQYARDVREPDLATLVRICRVLGVRPDVVLGFMPEEPATEDERLRLALGAAAQALSGERLRFVVETVEAIVAHGKRPTSPPPTPPRKPRGRA